METIIAIARCTVGLAASLGAQLAGSRIALFQQVSGCRNACTTHNYGIRIDITALTPWSLLPANEW